MDLPKIFGKSRNDVLSDIGGALRQVKVARGLTSDDMRAVLGLKCEDMISKYIAGDHAMDVVAWMRACEAWPELTERLEESERERVLRGRQRALELEVPKQESKAA
jgi:hypothetical protein